MTITFLILNIVMLITLMFIKTFPKMFYYNILMLLTILNIALNSYIFYFTLHVSNILLVIIKIFIINELVRIHKNIK